MYRPLALLASATSIWSQLTAIARLGRFAATHIDTHKSVVAAQVPARTTLCQLTVPGQGLVSDSGGEKFQPMALVT